MANRIGTVLVFAEGTTADEAAKALESIRHVLDLPAQSSEPEYFTRGGERCVTYHKIPFKMKHKLRDFDDDIGGPVWYIP